jgi:hypothetical protein
MKLITILAIALLNSSALYSQSKTDSVAIVKLLRNDYLALGNSDIEAHYKNCSNDYLLIENGEIWNLEKEVEYMKTNIGSKTTRTDQLDFMTVKVSRRFGYVVYDLRTEITINGKTNNYHSIESAVLNKHSGGWKIKLIHSTKLTE